MGKVIKYKYQSDKPQSYLIEGEYWPSFKSPYLQIRPHKKGTYVLVTQGYAWDGCSPKFRVFDLEIGTPEGVTNWSTKKPITYRASLVHDALYQYKYDHQISRKQADQLFLQVLQKENFFWAKAYYYAVRAFGWWFNIKWNGKGITIKNWNKR